MDEKTLSDFQNGDWIGVMPNAERGKHDTRRY
jgi:hypothetical protein